MATGKSSQPGVHNNEEMDPEPFLELLGKHGLPWQVMELPVD
jgi:saccharopine dehydrogenase (NAD+, L-lysine-forming)